MTRFRLAAGAGAIVAAAGLVPALAIGGLVPAATAAPAPAVQAARDGGRPVVELTGPAGTLRLTGQRALTRSTAGSATSTAPGTAPVTTSPATPSGDPHTYPPAVVSRLTGADRYATAVAVSRHRFPTTARSVYLVSGTAWADAVAVGAASDGPVLLVPSHGAVPAAVRAEVARLRPAHVYVVGGAGVVPTATARAAAGSRAVVRLAGRDRYATAVAVTRHLFTRPIPRRGSSDSDTGEWPQALLVDGSGGIDGLLAGVAAGPSMAVLPLPTRGPVPAVLRAEVARLRLAHVAATNPVMGSARALLGTRADILPMSMPDRYQQSILDAYLGLGDVSASAPVYVARGDAPVDLLAAGPLQGMVLLVRPDGTVPYDVARMLPGVQRIVVLGGVPQRSVALLRDASRGILPTEAPQPASTSVTASSSAPSVTR